MTLAPPRRLDRRSAAELRAIDRAVIHLEETEAWKRVHGLANRVHYATVAERPDVIAQSTAELRAIAVRRLRQLEGGNDVA